MPNLFATNGKSTHYLRRSPENKIYYILHLKLIAIVCLLAFIVSFLLFFFITHQRVCACRVRYCFTSSVRRPSVRLSVYPSVRLSNASTVSKRIDILSHFLTFWQGIILVFFSSTTSVTKFQGKPLSGGVKY